MEYYLATENYKIRPFAATWLDLEVVILSEMSDRERKVLYDMAYIKNLKWNIQMNLFTKKKQTHRLREWICGY